jgi:hypothetical protein
MFDMIRWSVISRRVSFWWEAFGGLRTLPPVAAAIIIIDMALECITELRYLRGPWIGGSAVILLGCVSL